MVQFNLLPDVKIEYLKARRQKHLVVLVSSLAAVAGIAVLLILVGVVYVVQKKNLSDLSKDIKSNTQKLSSTQDLDKILTVQNQLSALPVLHAKKPVTPRLFTYISQVTPAQVSITKLDMDFTAGTITITGSADSLDRVNTYADTLKFTTYATKGEQQNDTAPHAFSGVVLTNFGRDKKGATFTLSTTFDPAIFSQAQDVSLTVPKIISTRSAVEQPTALFQNSTSGGGQ